MGTSWAIYFNLMLVSEGNRRTIPGDASKMADHGTHRIHGKGEGARRSGLFRVALPRCGVDKMGLILNHSGHD